MQLTRKDSAAETRLIEQDPGSTGKEAPAEPPFANRETVAGIAGCSSRLLAVGSRLFFSQGIIG
jgi:hypothetical protein